VTNEEVPLPFPQPSRFHYWSMCIVVSRILAPTHRGLRIAVRLTNGCGNVFCPLIYIAFLSSSCALCSGLDSDIIERLMKMFSGFCCCCWWLMIMSLQYLVINFFFPSLWIILH